MSLYELELLFHEARGKAPEGTKPLPPVPARPLPESQFLRYVAWWNVNTCTYCGRVHTEFDGLFEERRWIKQHPHEEGLHWVRTSIIPLKELLHHAVSRKRYLHVDMCSECTGAGSFPFAD